MLANSETSGGREYMKPVVKDTVDVEGYRSDQIYKAGLVRKAIIEIGVERATRILESREEAIEDIFPLKEGEESAIDCAECFRLSMLPKDKKTDEIENERDRHIECCPSCNESIKNVSRLTVLSLNVDRKAHELTQEQSEALFEKIWALAEEERSKKDLN